MGTLRLHLCTFVAATLFGCTAPVGVSSLEVPADAGETCRSQCATIGMEVSAVALMANNVGCVCQPAGAEGTTAAAATEAAMVAIMRQREQEEQRQRMF